MLTQHPSEIDTPAPEQASWASKVLVPEMWGTVAIATMWLAVLFVGVFGSNIVFHDSSGSSSTWPVVTLVALFALLGTVPVARRVFRQRRD